LSFDERSALMRERRLRLESRLDPKNREMYQRRTQRVRARVAAGEIDGPGSYPRTERHRQRAEAKAKISEAHRGRVHHYGRDRKIAAALAGLGEAALQGLAEPGRTALAARYGLGAEPSASTYMQLSQRLSLSRTVLARHVRDAVRQVLGAAYDREHEAPTFTASAE
jgi:hypothetical protein